MTDARDPHAVSLGAKGGRARTEAQNAARRAALVNARAKRAAKLQAERMQKLKDAIDPQG